MSAPNASNSFLDVLIDKITHHPRFLLQFVLVVGGLLFSIKCVFTSIVVLVVSRIVVKKPGWWIVLFGLLLVLLNLLVVKDSLQFLYYDNRAVFLELIHLHFHLLFHIYSWILSIPYGVLLGGILERTLQVDRGLQGEIRRVGRGEASLLDQKISPKQLECCLKHLSHSAYKTGTILGVDQKTGQYACLADQDANLHALMIGTTGSGKTTSLGNIIESAVLRELPLFYVDGKGDLELAHRVRDFARHHQRPFYLFSMIGESLKYNPISFGGFTSKKDRIVELREWSEEHYRKLAEGYLQTVFQILEIAKVDLDLKTLSHYMEPQSLYALIRDRKDPALIADIETLEANREDMHSLIAEIKNISKSEIGHLFDCSQGVVMTLERILKERAIGYFCLQPLAFPAYAELLGKLIINDLKSLMASQLQYHKKIKIYTIFDEFSTFAGEQIINLINQGRSAGVHAILSTQSLSDMLRKGGEAFLGQVLNNVNNYLIQRQNNPRDAEILANIIGTEDDFQITSQVSAEECGAPTGSIRQVKEFIIHPDQIKRLGLGEAILVNKQRFSVQSISTRKGAI